MSDTPNADAPARDDQTPGPGYEELPEPTDDEFDISDQGEPE